MKKLTMVLRILLGALLVFFSLNAMVLHLFTPPQPPPAGMAVRESLTAIYIMALDPVMHLLFGALLLANRWVPLALVLHAPISVGMVMYHLGVDPSHGQAAFGILAVHLFLFWAYRGHFKGMLVAKAEPTV